MAKLSKERKRFIEFYAERVKSGNEWRKEHKEFIDSQVDRANQFYERLILGKDGIERFMKITGASKVYAKKFYRSAKMKKKEGIEK